MCAKNVRNKLGVYEVTGKIRLYTSGQKVVKDSMTDRWIQEHLYCVSFIEDNNLHDLDGSSEAKDTISGFESPPPTTYPANFRQIPQRDMAGNGGIWRDMVRDMSKIGGVGCRGDLT